MVKSIIPVFFYLLLVQPLLAQQAGDTSVVIGEKIVTLSEVVVNNKLNVANFINQVKNDTSFYKAFRNLHLLNFTAINDIRMMNKDGSPAASLHSKTKQIRSNGCRSMQVLDEQVTGDYYTPEGQLNYYTAQMYSSLFFTKDSICGETNTVAGREFSTGGKSGLEKHKEQLKMLFFNPGKKIKGLPFMSNKTAIYDDDMADLYDMAVDMEDHSNTSCIVFRQKVKPGSESKVVVDEMTTWFDEKSMEVVARNYSISYDAAVYDFKVTMDVELTHAGNLLVPSLIRYNGNWKAIFKKRESGVFTATLSDIHG